MGIIDLLLVIEIVAVPILVIAAIVPVVSSIVIGVILLLDLVGWHSAISSNMPYTIALVAHWCFTFSLLLSFPPL